MASMYVKDKKIYLSIYHNGKRVIRATGLDDNAKNRKRVKNELLPNVLFKIQTGQIDLYPKEVGTVRHYADILIESKRGQVKQSTFSSYEGILNLHILPSFGNRPINSFKVSEMKRWVNYYVKNRSAATAIRIANTFAMVFREAMYDEVIEKNPFDLIKRPKKNHKEAQPFTVDEMKCLLENSEGWFQNFLAVSFLTGMRTGEVVGIKWSDINFETMEIEVNRTRRHGIDTTPKTEKSKRIVPIFNELVPYIQAQHELTGDQKCYVFLTQWKKPFNDSHRIRDFHWKKLLQKCGLEYRRIYDTRSTFATMMLNTGKFTVNEIAQVLGHTNVQMIFTRYNKFIKSEVKNINRDIGI